MVVLDRFTNPVPPPAEPPSATAPAPSGTPVPAQIRHATAATAGSGRSAPSGPVVAELRKVTFAYGPSARPVLDGLDLTVRRGEHLAVVGPSGSGKSTLAAVLAGVVPPTGGEVRWYGRPTADLDPRSARTLLPQQAYVFTASLRDNLRYLRTDASEQDIAETVDALGLHGLLDRLGGPDAMVEPALLSQGERQLIALGRAHLATAPLLILDEATSHLDPAAEARAETALAARAGTLVVIAHRLTSAARADRILVVDGARTAQGTSAELLESSALYRDLTGTWAPEPGRAP